MNIDSTINVSASNHRDEIKSIVSNSSSFSDYQDQDDLEKVQEFQNYSLVDYTQSSTSKNDSGCDIQYEESVNDLSQQLQSALTSNQKHVNDLYTLKKNIEMQYHFKLGTLVKNNSQLKSELTKANEQIERLLKQFGTINGNSNLNYYFVKLEKENYDLISQNSLLQAKFSQIKTEKDEAELLLEQLGTELNQYKIDIDMKNAVLIELKNKITNQYAEITEMSKNVYSFSHMFDESNIELQHTKKILEWYKQELYSFQGNKKTLLADLANCKKEMSVLKETISNLYIELENTNNKYESSQLKALREKINLFTTLQEYESPATSKMEKHHFVELPNGSSAILKTYENSIQDLNNEILRINTFVEVQNATIEKVTRENSDLLSRCITFQKLLEQKENAINSLEIEKKHSKMEIGILTNREQQINEEYNKMMKELINLRTELVMSKQENDIIESTVKTMRNQVSIFRMKHGALKEELSNKNKQISSLQSEKQELFMKNSWQICELEKLNDRDALISSLKKEIELKEQVIQKYSHEVKDLEDAIEKQGVSVSKVIDEKQILTSENEKEIERYEFVLQQYKDLLLNSEEKVNDLRKYYTVNTIHQKTDQIYSSISLIDSCENLDDDLKTFIKVKFPETSDLVKLNNATLFEKGSFRATSINNSNSCNVQNTEQMLDNKLQYITERAKKLSEKIVECQKLLKNIFSAMQSKGIPPCETIDELRVLLQVKNLEMEEKQKKYEKINRLLLRKAREHMKAQTLAEKRHQQLQERFKGLSDENNLLKSTIENQMKDGEKLKSAFKLEERLDRISPCQNECFENQEQIETLEILNSENGQLCEIVDNVDIIDKPKKKVRNSILENTCLINNNNIRKTKCSGLLKTQNSSDVVKSLEEKLGDDNSPMSELMKTFEESSRKELRDKIEFLSNENQILRFSLQKKTEEFENLEGDLSEKQINFEKSTQDSSDLINEMKNHINEIQIERESTDREKFFLQRICNDLKLSLKSQSNYCKILEEKVSHFSERPKNFTSLPDILPGSSCLKIYDVQCINNLLQYKVTGQETKLTEVRGCLDSLRKQIFSLQEQIKKNYNAE